MIVLDILTTLSVAYFIGVGLAYGLVTLIKKVK